jgi:ribosomal protein S18 acetylase RimI-like enzyme
VKVHVRPAGPEDAPWLAELAERTFRETYTVHNTPENMEAYVAGHFGANRQATELRDPAMTTLIAEVGAKPAGYTQLLRSQPPPSVRGPVPLEILRFYVDRAWHGQGVAQTLMAEAVVAARAAGATTLWLGVWERNERAIAFYRKCGFRDVGTETIVVVCDLHRV